MSQTVLVLGAGVGGLVAANVLRRHLPPKHQVIVVDRAPHSSLAASYLWVMSGARRPEQVSRPLDRLQRKGIQMIHGEVEQIDPSRREAMVGGRRIGADHLIVALGAEFNPKQVEGLSAGGLTFATLDGATRLNAALSELREGRIVILTAAPLYKCPAAPYEAAMLIEAYYRRRGITGRVHIDLHTAEPGPMGVAGPVVSAAVRAMVESKKIGYHPERQAIKVHPGERFVEFTDGERVRYDLLVYMPPVQAPRVVRESSLAGKSGWVEPNRHTLLTQFPGVYALGDVASIPLSMGKPLPKAGVFAHGQALVVARNIVRAITGSGSEAKFDGYGACFVEVGQGKAGYGAGNFFAEPRPAVTLHRPNLWWHAGKLLFEKYWFWRWL
ncbi:MAG: pyridine nucleotide-disulfide oxidoreductase [Spirochaetes bacterium GWB1_59_5]|nr:MAG: pyridine nucleotide-disulfide oxidoreductase [Spirochaetes bacterium GWB1_59_5]